MKWLQWFPFKSEGDIADVMWQNFDYPILQFWIEFINHVKTYVEVGLDVSSELCSILGFLCEFYQQWGVENDLAGWCR